MCHILCRIADAGQDSSEYLNLPDHLVGWLDALAVGAQIFHLQIHLHGGSPPRIGSSHVRMGCHRIVAVRADSLANQGSSIFGAIDIKTGFVAASVQFDRFATAFQNRAVFACHGRTDTDALCAWLRRRPAGDLIHHGLHLFAFLGRHFGQSLLHLGLGRSHLGAHVTPVYRHADLFHFPQPRLQVGTLGKRSAAQADKDYQG